MPRTKTSSADKPRTPADEIEAFAGDPDFMTSLARGIAVIRAFDESHTRLTVAQASERSGLPRSAARRCLYTLQKLGYVEADGSSFALKPRIVALGHVYMAATPLSASAQPVLDRVALAMGETCTLAVLDRDDILFIAHSSRVPLVSVNFAVGSRLPAYCSANGRVLLAALAEPELDRYMARLKPARLTEKTVTTKRQLQELVQQAREDGYALVDQEFDLKIRTVAVPVRHGGRIAASMSVSVPVERVSVRELKSRLLPLLLEAAGEFA